MTRLPRRRARRSETSPVAEALLRRNPARESARSRRAREHDIRRDHGPGAPGGVRGTRFRARPAPSRPDTTHGVAFRPRPRLGLAQARHRAATIPRRSRESARASRRTGRAWWAHPRTLFAGETEKVVAGFRVVFAFRAEHARGRVEVPKRPPHLAMSRALGAARLAERLGLRGEELAPVVEHRRVVRRRARRDARPPRPLDPWSMSSNGPSRSTAFAIDAAQLRPATPRR